ncbi:hypothetical protein PAAG_11187 [Paracoccidioides lutzii Pb01]|uniref:Uncharacterized protein n=1 Tax=Paracoccidioides lutzii (strain ATCC MYA-826 / Pb01) TaxID=502779 RepID=A0A0A2V6N3_PARBA|nr:hypothetical protein PAAG_11187 [Paracoccidioides lutzii Pb01]KGQ02012.1 hypothetical protein PAAG_11187 [Paracoccidioides lutzii Pb01]
MKKSVAQGGRRALTVTHEKAIRGNMTNLMILTDHPKPREESFSNFEIAIGNMTPPIDEPATVRPNAVARFWPKYWDTVAIAENFRRANELFLCPIAGSNRGGRGRHTHAPKRSNNGPTITPMENCKNTDKNPIQGTPVFLHPVILLNLFGCLLHRIYS